MGHGIFSTVVAFGMLLVFHSWYSDLGNLSVVQEKNNMQLNFTEAP